MWVSEEQDQRPGRGKQGEEGAKTFAASWMDLGMIVLSEVRERQIPYDITYMWNLKYATNEPIYETATDSQIYVEKRLVVAEGEGGVRR